MRTELLNAYMDAVVVTDPNEKFEELDVNSPRGLVVVFDANHLTQKEGKKLMARVRRILKDANSLRLNALDFVTNAQHDGNHKPIEIIVLELRAHYDGALSLIAESQHDSNRTATVPAF